MDPYLTLGVPRGCTHEDLKDAFRAKVHHAHPDHGGEAISFIRLRSAYEQILAELDPALGSDDRTIEHASRDVGSPRSHGQGMVGDSYEAWFRHVASRSARPKSVWGSTRIRQLGTLILLSLLVVNVAVCWMIWSADSTPHSPAPPVKQPDELDELEGTPGPISLADSSNEPRRWQQPPANPRDLFVIPFDATLYVAPVEGGHGDSTEFGLITSKGDRLPIFTGLPAHPEPDREVEVGPVSAGDRLSIYLRKGNSWVFSDAELNGPWYETFSDRDNSLGGRGSIIEQTERATWVLHLDDVGSKNDSDDDLMIQIRLVRQP